MTKHVAKIVLDGARTELADAISEIESAERAADVASEAVELAQSSLRTAKSGHAVAVAALEEATSPPRTLDQKLKEACSVDEQLEIADAHDASLCREPLTAEDLKRLRQGVDAAADALTIARSGLEVAEARARPTVSALNRAKDRRQQAVYALVKPEVSRLVHEVQAATETLVAKRAALNFVSSALLDPYGDEQRQASFCLIRLAPFPEEQGLKTDSDLSKRDASIAAWQEFAAKIAEDAATPFPAS
jgi:hypothetical protein